MMMLIVAGKTAERCSACQAKDSEVEQRASPITGGAEHKIIVQGRATRVRKPPSYGAGGKSEVTQV